MRRVFKRETSIYQWIGYTDVLSSILLVLLLVTTVSALSNANNQKPPLIKLTEGQSFRFPTGSYALSPEFKLRLDRLMGTISANVKKYRIDTIEVIGHTDGQPSSGRSDLDIKLSRVSGGKPNLDVSLNPGSNVDLGFLRALSVSSYIKQKLEVSGTRFPTIVPYSAGSLVDIHGKFNPADLSSDSDRRRIEIRFTRSKL